MLIDGSGSQGLVSSVVGAIRDAATATGTRFQYLLATARVESGLNPQASAAGSSAQGLFQFIEQTWLNTLKQAGAALGYGNYANAITQTPSGRYEVADPAMRQQILALRNDPTANAAMAGVFTQQNAQQMAGELGRPPSDGELYIAHFLGPSGASRLITMASNTPNASAASAFPGAARANRSIFYDRQGNARTAAQVYGVLVGRYQTAAARPLPGSPAVTMALVQTAADTSPGTPSRLLGTAGSAAFAPDAGVASASAVATAADASSAVAPISGFRSLFSDRNGAPVSQVVRDLWSSRPTVAAALTGQASPGTAVAPVAGSGSLDLFSDRPPDVRGLFGAGS